MLRLKQCLTERVPDQHDAMADIRSLIKACQDWDGYVREEAIKRLAELGEQAALPQLLARANDWVPQVRKAALAAIHNLMTRAHSAAFVEQLPALYHLRLCGRATHEALIAKVEQFLLLPEQQPTLRAGLTHPNRCVARHVARLCLANQLLVVEEWIPRLLQQHDVVLKVMALRQLAKLDAEQLATLMPTLLRECFMPVRREAYLYCLRHFPEQQRVLLEQMTLDQHRAIREVARYWIKDDKQPYVEHCLCTLHASASPKQKSAVLLALGELGAWGTAAVIQAYLSDALPCLRKAALTSLAMLKQPLDGLLLHALQDESISVVKCANILISRQGCWLASAQLTQLAEQADSTQRLSVYLALLEQLGKWDRLLALLDLRVKFVAQPDFSSLVSAHLALWQSRFNARYSIPNVEQLQALRNWLNQHHTLIAPTLRQHLEFDLRCFSKK